MDIYSAKEADHVACDAMMEAGAAALDRETIKLLGRKKRWEPELHHQIFVSAAWLEADACIDRICEMLEGLSCFWSLVARRDFPLFCVLASAKRKDYELFDLPWSAHFLPAATLTFNRLVLDAEGTLRLYATRDHTPVLDFYRESSRAWMSAKGMEIHEPGMLTVMLGRFQGVRMWDRDGDFEGDFKSLREEEHQGPVFKNFVARVKAWDSLVREDPLRVPIKRVIHDRLSDLLHEPFGHLMGGMVRRSWPR